MLIVVPAEGRFAEVEGALDAALLARIFDELSGYRVTLSMPRFSFEVFGGRGGVSPVRPESVLG